MYTLTCAEHNLSFIVRDMIFDTDGVFKEFKLRYEHFFEAIAYGLTKFELYNIVFTVWTKQGRLDFSNKWEFFE